MPGAVGASTLFPGRPGLGRCLDWRRGRSPRVEPGTGRMPLNINAFSSFDKTGITLKSKRIKSTHTHKIENHRAILFVKTGKRSLIKY